MAGTEQLPYSTFGMFDSCVERFVESVVPTTLNRHVLHDLSGGDYSALGTTLRFFDFVDDERKVQQAFKQLVEAKRSGGTAYRDALRKLIDDHYPDPIKQVEIERATLPDLEKAFRDAGVKQGQMTTKALRFYIKALSDGCGVKVSEHITKQKRRPSRPKNSKAVMNKATKQNELPEEPANQLPPSAAAVEIIPKGFARLPIPGLRDAFIQHPADLTKVHVKLLESAVAYLTATVQVREEEEDPA